MLSGPVFHLDVLDGLLLVLVWYFLLMMMFAYTNIEFACTF